LPHFFAYQKVKNAINVNLQTAESAAYAGKGLIVVTDLDEKLDSCPTVISQKDVIVAKELYII